jgi:hypothetical protein
MGCDPTIGGPAQAATWAGPFLMERSHCNDSRSYKDGLSSCETHLLTSTLKNVMGFAQPILRATRYRTGAPLVTFHFCTRFASNTSLV